MNPSSELEQLTLALEKYSRVDQPLKTKIQQLVNDLIVHDFNQLVNFLYRMDINESKLKKVLHNNPSTDASVLITELLIERQLEKIKTKMSFDNKDNVDESEKW
jgi:hypothetical protein